jgi:Domain of unknown function (DUF4112)
MAFSRTGTMAFSGTGAFAGFQPSGARRDDDARSRRAAVDRIDMLATLFDTAFVVPGTKIRFGAEALLRLVPGIGDAAASALSLYLVYEASRLGVPRLLLARMLANVVLEGAVGAVAFAGDAFDVLFRANRRNSRCCAGISRERAIIGGRRANGGGCRARGVRCSIPSMMRTSRTAPSPSALSASW